MTVIKMPAAINDNNISDAFLKLFRVIVQVDNSQSNEIVLDFEDTCFLTPFFILPLSLFLSQCNKQIKYINLSQSIQSYFDIIHFNQGKKPESVDDFEKYMNYFATKNYIPVINFPVSSNQNEKSNVLSIVCNILAKQVKITGNYFSALNYILNETVDNIEQHSECKRGYIFAQYYPTKKYIDICIADNGITVLGSFEKIGNDKIITHVDALQNACIGVSTKNLPEAENRGYGIQTCKKMLAQGLKGIYFLISGNAFHLWDKNDSFYSEFPEGINWNGTIVSLRVPFNEESFNMYDFLE